MKVNNVFNIVGAAFTLAAIGMIIARPQIIATAGSALSSVIGSATAPVRDITGRR